MKGLNKRLLGAGPQVTSFLEDFIVLADSNTGNDKGRVFTHNIAGVDSGNTEKIDLPDDVVSAVLLEENLIYTCVTETGKSILYKTGAEPVDFGYVMHLNPNKPAFTVKGGNIAFISGPKEVKFVKGVAFAPIEHQNYSIIGDIEVAGCVVDVQILSSSELIVVGS